MANASMNVTRERETDGRILQNPRWVTALFSSTDWAWLWLMVRLYLGVSWMKGGWHKLSEEPWTGTGVAVKGFWDRAVAIPEGGRPAISYDWYREMLQFMLDNELWPIFGKLIAFGEVAVGLGLIVGLFTGIAAFSGALMNWNFMLAGTSSTNPVLGLTGILVVLAWKTAGWWGLDRWALPMVGAPWQRGKLFGGAGPTPEGDEPHTAGYHIEQWIRMAVAAVAMVLALAYLDSVAQIAVIALAYALAATTGLGILSITKMMKK
jgi:thiosulfate dehydrogenase [quinone] large subunit